MFFFEEYTAKAVVVLPYLSNYKLKSLIWKEFKKGKKKVCMLAARKTFQWISCNSSRIKYFLKMKFIQLTAYINAYNYVYVKFIYCLLLGVEKWWVVECNFPQRIIIYFCLAFNISGCPKYFISVNLTFLIFYRYPNYTCKTWYLKLCKLSYICA